GQQIEQPLRHILIQSGQHRQDLVLSVLLNQFRQGVERRVGVPMVMAPGVDQMDQIPRQRVRPVPVLHASIMPEAPSCRKTYSSFCHRKRTELLRYSAIRYDGAVRGPL